MSASTWTLKKSEIGLWATSGKLFSPVFIHKKTCRMLKIAGGLVVKIETQKDLDDLEKRGYPIKPCKCLNLK